MSANLGWLFYKDYFDGIEDYLNIDEKAIAKKVDKLIDEQVVIERKAEEEKLGNAHFKATTTYPGLLLGIGNGHELPSVKGQAILGFHFDYTTGLPVITGSSIKGVLRSAFNSADNYGYIRELLKELEIDSSVDIANLEAEIFGQKNGNDSTQKGKDVFFDAEIIGAVGNILGDDYITPHKDPLTEPVPLRFIKVLPQVTFMFDFELTDGILTADEKELLFRFIIQDLGLGAKTNVGYGYFEEVNIDSYKKEKEKNKANNTAGFEGFLLQLKLYKKVDNQMWQFIKKYEGEIEKKEELLEIVNSKHPDFNGKPYKRIMKYLE